MTNRNAKNTEKLKKAAIELFQLYGYPNVTVNQICKRAEVARSSFYSIFRDKDELVISIYTMHLTQSESLMTSFALQKNDFERIWLLYDYYVSLAMEPGYAVTAAMISIEVNRNIGIYDHMMQIRKWSVPLCQNCQEQGIIRNLTTAEDLIRMVSACLNNMVFEWCRLRGKSPLRQDARKAVECLFDVAPAYRKV
ncbi:MAG: TetR/AcrR family transcriptional regulator [Lachnospiraceae bacterium]|nr:TetR/AcrR family transcriptional regulator [Lachnospiraceae bacterium]